MELLSSPSKRKIKIINKDESVNVMITDNALKKCTLLEYFPDGGVLHFESKDGPVFLETDEENFYLIPEIDSYILSTRKGTSTGLDNKPKKRKTFFDILKKVRELDNPSAKKKPNQEKVLNKKQQKELMQQKMESDSETVCEKDTYLKRVMFLGWKYKESESCNFENLGSIGKSKKIELNGNKNYSIEELKNIFLKEYVNDRNRLFFDNAAAVSIGHQDGRIITSFINEKQKPCSFWEYSRMYLRNASHTLKIYLLTTGLDFESAFPKFEMPKMDLSSNSMNNSNAAAASSNVLALPKSVENQNRIQKNTDTSTSKFKVVSQTKEKLCAIKSVDNQNNVQRTDSTVQKPEVARLTTDKFCDLKSGENNKNTINLLDISIPSPPFSTSNINIKDKTEHEATLKNSEPGNDVLVRKKNENKDTNSCDFAVPKLSVKKDKLNSMRLGIKCISEEEIQFTGTIFGSGAQGTVSKAKYLGSVVAVKSIHRGRCDKLALREIQLLDSIRHPNIVSIMAVCESFTQFHIVTEYFESKSLFDIIFVENVKKQFDLTVANKLKITQKLLCALAYLHEQSVPIIHRDIKSSNILVNHHFETKLCDLGLGKSKSVDISLQSTKNNVRGTYIFMAPEILLLKEEASTFSDVWAFACTIVELFNEKMIWNAQELYYDSYIMTIENLRQKNVPNLDNIPRSMKTKIKQCFNYDATKRPSMLDILFALENYDSDDDFDSNDDY